MTDDSGISQAGYFIVSIPVALVFTDSVKGAAENDTIKLFLCGDVMTGRGIDQILASSCNSRLHEPFVSDARYYVELAESVNGPIPRPVATNYIWNQALKEFDRFRPDARIINLETSITRSEDYWPGKGIHYRMHPDNIALLVDAGIDCCALANNHVLDWGYAGLRETLDVLARARIKTPGAGLTVTEARLPAAVEIAGKGRVLVLSVGTESSGIEPGWAAGDDSPGVNFLPDLSKSQVERIAADLQVLKKLEDLVIVSIHWGANWGYRVSPERQWFARQLIDRAGVDVVHGHSSHHAMGIEVYMNKLIIYGCGDFINDYEGIGGHESFRSDLTLMYFVSLNSTTGELTGLDMVPLQLKRFSLCAPAAEDCRWLQKTLQKQNASLGTFIEAGEGSAMRLGWH